MLGRLRLTSKSNRKNMNSSKENESSILDNLKGNLKPELRRNRTASISIAIEDKANIKENDKQCSQLFKPILKKEANSNQKKAKISINNVPAITQEDDYLPFANRVLNFAEVIEPQKHFTTPLYSLDIEENYERLFENYHRQFSGHFKQQKRREIVSPIKRSTGNALKQETQYKKADLKKGKLMNFGAKLLEQIGLLKKENEKDSLDNSKLRKTLTKKQNK